MRQRAERVSKLLMKEISLALREDINDPEIGFVTLIEVEVAKDIKSAIVHYSVMGDDADKKKTEVAIKHHAKEIKRIVNDRIRLKYAINLLFRREDGIDHAFKVQEILDKINQDKEAHS